MRILIPIAGLALATFSLFLDYGHMASDSWLCRSGLCRFDQIFSASSHDSNLVTDVGALLNQDPSNPLVWCTYAELLSTRKQIPQATAAFDRAVSLGPRMDPVLIRTATFDFSHGREDHGFAMVREVLRGTDAYDQKIFDYLIHSSGGTFELLGTAVPPTPRAARAWLTYLRTHGSDDDLLQTWLWMSQNRIMDQKSAVDLAWTLWQRKSFRSAQEAWVTWLGHTQDGYLHPQRLANVRFEQEPNGSPFDWTIDKVPSVEVSRNHGIDVRFTGDENVNFQQVRQFATVTPGRYRFSAQISAEGITTDEGPFLHVFDAENPSRFSAQTPQVKGNVAKNWISLDLQTPATTQALTIQIERHPTLRFDNKIAGALHVYQVSLVPVR